MEKQSENVTSSLSRWGTRLVRHGTVHLETEQERKNFEHNVPVGEFEQSAAGKSDDFLVNHYVADLRMSTDVLRSAFSDTISRDFLESCLVHIHAMQRCVVAMLTIAHSLLSGSLLL